MNGLLKTAVVLMEIVGGLLGLVLIGRSFLTEDPNQIAMIIHGGFILVFLYGIVAGAALIKKPGLGLWLSLIYQGIQIPIIMSSVFSFDLFSGASFNVFRHSTGFGFNFLFGSRYYFYLNSGEPWLAGVNILALVLFFLLIREIRFESAIAESVESEPSVCATSGLQNLPLWRSV